MPDVHLVGLYDPNPQSAAQHSAAAGNPSIFTDYAQMLGETHAFSDQAYELAGQPHGTERC